MPIFDRKIKSDPWLPSPLAAGPFAGLQGGAIAGLLAGEIEAAARSQDWGNAISASIWFLRPVPLAPLRTQMTPMHGGGRIAIVDNVLRGEEDDRPLALARITLAKAKPIQIAGISDAASTPIDPTQYPLMEPRAPHGGPWFMDAMEVRRDKTISWFKLRSALVQGGGPISRILGPADWAHGINRPVANVVADPNPNLNVHLLREPCGEWIGVEAETQWQADTGIGLGGGLLRDVTGIVGRVSMSVALTAFPKLSR